MIVQADARHIPLADESVQCVITSPPYWGLRDYSVNGQLGLEPTPELYVEHIVEVFREVRRILRKDGTCWVNLGDSYCGSAPGSKQSWETSGLNGAATSQKYQDTLNRSVQKVSNKEWTGLKPKDLVGIPWRVAFALQADGWYLRSDIIWSKPNPMPESVTDRPTKSHEYIFLLAKSANYYFDQDAVREPAAYGYEAKWDPGTNGLGGDDRKTGKTTRRFKQSDNGDRNDGDRHVTHGFPRSDTISRNIRSVWTVATQPYSEAHFATFPEDLIKPCILAGTSHKGACVKCGAPWERVVEASGGLLGKAWVEDHLNDVTVGNRPQRPDELRQQWDTYKRETLGWRPSCSCGTEEGGAASGAKFPYGGNAGISDLKAEGHNCRFSLPSETRACIVFDPFVGSGTVVKVAQDLGRVGVGIDLKFDYLQMAKRRAAQQGFGFLLSSGLPIPENC